MNVAPKVFDHGILQRNYGHFPILLCKIVPFITRFIIKWSTHMDPKQSALEGPHCIYCCGKIDLIKQCKQLRSFQGSTTNTFPQQAVTKACSSPVLSTYSLNKPLQNNSLVMLWGVSMDQFTVVPTKSDSDVCLSKTLTCVHIT